MFNNEKRAYRQLKRDLKKAGNRDMRHYLKKRLKENPEEAQWDEYEYGHHSTAAMNGQYQDKRTIIKNERRRNNSEN